MLCYIICYVDGFPLAVNTCASLADSKGYRVCETFDQWVALQKKSGGNLRLLNACPGDWR